MKNKLLTLAAALVLLAVVGKFYAKPVMAQIRATLTQDVDQPARAPFQASVTVSINNFTSTSRPDTRWQTAGDRLHFDERRGADVRPIRPAHCAGQRRRCRKSSGLVLLRTKSVDDDSRASTTPATQPPSTRIRCP